MNLTIHLTLAVGLSNPSPVAEEAFRVYPVETAFQRHHLGLDPGGGAACYLSIFANDVLADDGSVTLDPTELELVLQGVIVDRVTGFDLEDVASVERRIERMLAVRNQSSGGGPPDDGGR